MLLTTQPPSMKVCMHNINLTAEARSGGSDRLERNLPRSPCRHKLCITVRASKSRRSEHARLLAAGS